MGKEENKNLSYKLIVFDLDGTLTKSKTKISSSAADLLCGLLAKKKVAVIGGAKFSQFKKQFLDNLKCSSALLENLLLLPTSGASFYVYRKKRWQLLQQNKLKSTEKKEIKNAFKAVFKKISYVQPQKVYGKVIEDRQTQITFSALGHKAPLAKKEEWRAKNDRRPEIKFELDRSLPEFTIRMGGLTSIDVTRKGIDKAHAVRQLMKKFKLNKKEIIFAGDALYKGGNDYEVIRTGVRTIKVDGPKQTEALINKLLK